MSQAATMSTATDLDRAVAMLGAARTVVLLAHVNPDADALGSALALGLALRRAGAAAQVSFAEPDSVPQSLQGLPGQELIVPPAAVLERPDLVVTLDAGSAERLGALARLLGESESLVVDHHRTNTRFGGHNLVDPDAEATAIIVVRLLDALGLPVEKDIAANLYAGLATDTSGFRTAGASAHRLAARLLDTGLDAVALMHPITESHPFGWLEMLARVLHRARLDRDAAGGRGLVHTWVGTADAPGLRSEEFDSIVDIVRTSCEAEVAAVIKQVGEDAWQVSLRSTGTADVAAVASSLGGGGHSRAAGFLHRGTPEDAVVALRAALAG